MVAPEIASVLKRRRKSGMRNTPTPITRCSVTIPIERVTDLNGASDRPSYRVTITRLTRVVLTRNSSKIPFGISRCTAPKSILR